MLLVLRRIPDADIYIKRQGTSSEPYQISGSGNPQQNMDIVWFLAYMQSDKPNTYHSKANSMSFTTA